MSTDRLEALRLVGFYPSIAHHPAFDRIRNSFSTSFWTTLDVMLPKSENHPTHPSQALNIAFVSLSVPFDFVPPIGPKSVSPPRKAPTVPEVTVHEHSDLGLVKD
jgi:hypothetical protein